MIAKLLERLGKRVLVHVAAGVDFPLHPVQGLAAHVLHAVFRQKGQNLRVFRIKRLGLQIPFSVRRLFQSLNPGIHQLLELLRAFLQFLFRKSRQYQGIKVSMTGMSESRQNYKLYCEVEAVAKDLPEDAKQWGISVMITAKILECMGCELILERKEKDRVVFSFALPQEVALLSSREDAWWFLDEFDSKVEI